MATYIILGTYTDQGAGKIKDSPKTIGCSEGLGQELGRHAQGLLPLHGRPRLCCDRGEQQRRERCAVHPNSGVAWQRANYDHPCLHGGAIQEDCRSGKMTAG